MKNFFPVAFLLLSSFIAATAPAYAQVNLGTSSSVTNPERSGDATTGLFSSSTGAVSISSAGTEMMRVNGTGVGIGTLSPQSLLTINKNASGVPASAASFISTQLVGADTNFNGMEMDAFGDNNVLYLNRYDGTYSSETALQSGDAIASLSAGGYNGSSLITNKAGVIFAAGGNWSTTSTPTYITFGTAAVGSTTKTERMRIDTTGNVGIGTTSPANPLTVNGVIQSTTGGVKFPDGTTQTTAATAAGSTGMVLLATVNASAASSVVFNATYLTSTYNKYVIEYDSLYTSDLSEGEVDMVLSANNGSSYLTTTGYYGCQNANSNGFKVSVTQNSSTYVGMGTIKFMGPGITTQPMIDMRNTVSSGFEGVINQDCFGTFNNVSTTYSINAVKLYDPLGGTITGNFHLYGLQGT